MTQRALKAAKPLRAVAPGETAPPKTKFTVTTAASDGDRLDLLIALRARIAQTVEDSSTPARDLAALSRRLLEIARDIEAIESSEEGDHAEAAADESWDESAI